MANDNNSRQKSASSTPKTANTTNTTNNTNATQQQVAATPAPAAKKGGAKGKQSHVGGTAVPGAKSTLPKQIPTNNNNSAQQQAESYNRDMRRRMQHLGTGPNENKANTVQEQRRKRIERRKQRVEEERARLRRSTPGGKITLGRRNLYFILGTVALVVLLIVIFVVLRMNHIIQS